MTFLRFLIFLPSFFFVTLLPQNKAIIHNNYIINDILLHLIENITFIT